MYIAYRQGDTAYHNKHHFCLQHSSIRPGASELVLTELALAHQHYLELYCQQVVVNRKLLDHQQLMVNHKAPNFVKSRTARYSCAVL